MGFIKLLGIVLSIYASRCASEYISGQRICRRGTEWPCYKVVYFPDARHRMTFDQAGETCRREGGELLSIQSESEQLLIEQVVQQVTTVRASFWMGLQRAHTDQEVGGGCSAAYHWLDGSQTTFRNWLSGEPSCGAQVCAAMHLDSSSSWRGRVLYKLSWADDDCSARKHFICKYSKEKTRKASKVSTAEGHTVGPTGLFLTQKPPVTLRDESTELNTNVSIIVWPAVGLLLVVLLVSGAFCFRFYTAIRKKHLYKGPPGGLDPPGPGVTSHCPTVFSLVGDYENLPERAESGFVTNDIYEICQGRDRPSCEAGWVENEIYGS